MPQFPPRLHRIASVAVTACFLYQLGVCPCGCSEHNYWLQACGAHESHTAEETPLEAEVHADEHDCSGEPTRIFCDNSRSVKSLATVAVARYVPAPTTKAGPTDLGVTLAAQSAHAHYSARLYARLQVFRL